MSTLFHRNPRLLVLTVLLVIAAGLSAFTTLPRMEDPELSDRNAVVLTRLPGAGAERVEALVTDKLEEELEEIEEIKHVDSSSRPGISILSIELADSVTNTDPVWSRVRDQLSDAEPELPRAATKPDLDVKDIQAYTLISALTWTRDDAPNHALLRRLAEDLEAVLSAVPGTDEAELFGDVDEEIVVEIDPAQLATLGLSAEDVAAAIGAADSKVAAGLLRGSKSELIIEVEGELDSLEQVASTPLRYGAGGRVLRVGDIATVRKAMLEPVRELALIDGDAGVAVAARMAVGRRVDQWMAQVNREVAAFETTLPEGIVLTRVFDQSVYTAARLGDLMTNLLLGAGLVLAVIWFMMGWRSALLVGSALPLTTAMVLFGMKLLDVPMHQFSITGLIIALGLLIDNAIVMVDEVRHRLDEGLGRSEAIARAIKALAVPLLGSTFTTALAFAPILLMPGPAGEFVGAMAVSVVLAIGASLALSLTVLPALTARVEGAVSRARTSRWWRDGFRNASLLRLHRTTLDFLLRRPWLGVLFALLLPVVGFTQGRHLVEQFFPPADRNQFYVDMRLPLDAAIGGTRAAANEARELLLSHPEVEHVHWFAGVSAPKFYYNVLEGENDTAYFAQALVQLNTRDGVAPLIRRVQSELDAAFPDAQLITRQLEQGPPFAAPIELRLFGPDLETLESLGQDARRILAEVPGVVHTRATQADGRPKLWLRLDQEEANRAGLTNVDVARQLDHALEGVRGGSILEATEELPVRVRLRGEDRGDMDQVRSLELRPRPGSGRSPTASTPLGAFGELELRPELARISRRDGARVNTIHGFTAAGMLPEAARADYEQRLQTGDFALPPGYRMEFGGETAKRDEAVGNMMSSVGLLLVLMAGSLVLSFNSFRMAGIIGSVAVLSLGLSVGALWFWGYPFGFMAIVGSMGLLGIAINDAIVVLAAIRDDERARRGDVQAVREVVIRSTRHVLATSVTTMAGFTPLLLAGGGFWPPLAVAIAGGVAGATVLALYFVPATYLLLPRPAIAGARS